MMNKEDKNTISSTKLFLQCAAILFAVLTPYAYLLGVTYYQGYMSAFGVSSDTFPKTTSDVYVDAYAAIGLMIIDVFKLFEFPEFYGLLLLLVALIASFWELGAHQKRCKSLEKVRDVSLKILNCVDFKNNTFFKTITYVSVVNYLLLILLIVVLCFWWGLPYWAEKKGESMANDQIQKYVKSGCFFDKKTRWNNCIYVKNKNNKTIQVGLLVAQNENDLAIFKKDGSYIFKLDDTVLIRKERN